MRYLWDHYHLPMMITENGYGAHETKDADGQVHDQGRIDYLREHIYQLGMAIEDGCEVIAYNPWSFTDLLSTGNGMESVTVWCTSTPPMRSRTRPRAWKSCP